MLRAWGPDRKPDRARSVVLNNWVYFNFDWCGTAHSWRGEPTDKLKQKQYVSDKNILANVDIKVYPDYLGLCTTLTASIHVQFYKPKPKQCDQPEPWDGLKRFITMLVELSVNTWQQQHPLPLQHISTSPSSLYTPL